LTRYNYDVKFVLLCELGEKQNTYEKTLLLEV